MNTNTLFLHIKDVTGSKPDAKNTGWIALEKTGLYISSNASVNGSTGSLSSNGSPYVGAVPLLKHLDKYSVKLSNHVLKSTEVGEVIIKLMAKLGAEDIEMTRWTFHNCVFTSRSLNLSNDSGTPMEELSMIFKSFEEKIIIPNGEGKKDSDEMNWSIVDNKQK